MRYVIALLASLSLLTGAGSFISLVISLHFQNIYEFTKEKKADIWTLILFIITVVMVAILLFLGVINMPVKS